MSLVRSLGRWSMTFLFVNCVIGSGIFGVPGELIKAVGRASPLAMLLAAAAISVFVAVFLEVSSQFSEAGGTYLYVRSAFGLFAGLQVGWFYLLSCVSASAVAANLFVGYAAGVFPLTGSGWIRIALITVLIAIPAVANCAGARSGANLSSLLVVAKLLPLALLVALGILRYGGGIQTVRFSDVAMPGFSAWIHALLLLVFSYIGFEDSLVPMGDVRDPRRTTAFSLAAGLAIVTAVYTLLQCVTVAAIGVRASMRPLAEVADVLMGNRGVFLISIAAMFSTYGYISGSALTTSRLSYSLAAQGDFPHFLGRLDSRWNTPVRAILFNAALVWLLAVTGTFKWVLVVTVGANMVIYAGACASLLAFRRRGLTAGGTRVPGGNVLAWIGIAISIILMTQVELRQGLLMSVTALIAALNWWWVRRKHLVLHKLGVHARAGKNV
jgi:amino acid transporter